MKCKVIGLLFLVLAVVVTFLVACSSASTPETVASTAIPKPISSQTPPQPTQPPHVRICKEIVWDIGVAKAWIDENNDGKWDSGEQPLENVQFWVDDTSHNVVKVVQAVSDLEGLAQLSIKRLYCDAFPTEFFDFEVHADAPSRFRHTTPQRLAGDLEGPFLFGFTNLETPTPTASMPTPTRSTATLGSLPTTTTTPTTTPGPSVTPSGLATDAESAELPPLVNVVLGKEDFLSAAPKEIAGNFARWRDATQEVENCLWDCAKILVDAPPRSVTIILIRAGSPEKAQNTSVSLHDDFSEPSSYEYSLEEIGMANASPATWIIDRTFKDIALGTTWGPLVLLTVLEYNLCQPDANAPGGRYCEGDVFHEATITKALVELQLEKLEAATTSPTDP